MTEKERLEDKQRAARKERSKDEEEWSTRSVLQRDRLPFHIRSLVDYHVTQEGASECDSDSWVSTRSLICIWRKLEVYI